MVSLDIVLLLINVLLKPTLKVLEPVLPVPIEELFNYVLRSIYFVYERIFYDQTGC